MKQIHTIIRALRQTWTYTYPVAPGRDRLPAFLRRAMCVGCRRSLKPGAECPACTSDQDTTK